MEQKKEELGVAVPAGLSPSVEPVVSTPDGASIPNAEWARRRKISITKSRAGHYTASVRVPGIQVKEAKLSSLTAARNALPELNARLDRLIVAALRGDLEQFS